MPNQNDDLRPRRELHWPIRLLIYALFTLDLLVMMQNWGEGSGDIQAGLGWAAVVLAIVAFDVMVEHLPPPSPGKILDLLLILDGAAVYALFQTSVMVYIFRGLTDPLLKDPVIWMISLMLALAAIGLNLYRYRR